MLTLFTTPKPFRPPFSLIQRNALLSWRALHPHCQVILFGNEPGTGEVAAELGFAHVPAVETNEFGTPLVNALFASARQRADHDLLCYVNADIILMSDFLCCAQRLAGLRQPFLMVGQRWDIDINYRLDCDPGWEHGLRAAVSDRGRLHGYTGIDFFLFRRDTLPSLPPFPVGRPGWDNYLIYRARRDQFAVVDVTAACTVIHQNHDYTHHPQGVVGVRHGPEAHSAWLLAGRGAHMLDIRDVNFHLDTRGMVRRTRPWRFLPRYLITWSLLTLGWTWPIRIVRRLIARWRQFRQTGSEA